MMRLALVLFVTGVAFAQQPETDLQTGIKLTREGKFQQAITHFLSARGHVVETFALEFNLALCYVGTHQYRPAIEILKRLRAGNAPAEVDNLLAQALIGDGQQDAAFEAFQNAASLTPKNEKLYLLVAEASADAGFLELGVKVLNAGLENLPESSRLHFERATFLARLDERDLANRDFDIAQKLSPGSDIAYIAAAQQAFLAGDVQKVIGTAREGISKGHTHYLLLTMLAEALLRAGATPATPGEFHEAQAALEKAVAERPSYSSAHIALGRVYLAAQRRQEAVEQLESAKDLDPRNPAVYSALAAAYRSAGQLEKSREALATLAELNRREAARIGAANGGHAGYAGGRVSPPK